MKSTLEEEVAMSRFDGYTGHLFEEEVLGNCQAECHGYMSWREAVELVRKSQPRHKTPVATRLEVEVGRQLGGVVKFFTAVHSAMDVFHGTDGFFEYCGVVVTIDVTTNPHKDCGKADMIVHQGDLENLSTLAGRIARELNSKLLRRG